ncbi:hypothetical protein KPL71_022143 [Citrus sinensis]|uniref:Uncharacterized protein n=1 Tax=Citrus sinensis TaxID=2711 RepID=A0ACB8JKL0_CITSI|nr:hypothetical protein KPL71_022143 [Citrus sinensis]
MIARQQPQMKLVDKSSIHCTHCRKKGHTKEQCFEIIGYSDWWDTRKKNTKQELKTAVAESTSSTDLRKESSVQIATSVSPGYALHQKGYRCYHPPSRKIYITMDLIFHEDIMYYLSETEFQGEYNEEEIHPLTYLPPEEGQSSIEVVNLQDTGKENGDDSQAEISEDTFGEHNNSDTTAIENESHEEMSNQSSTEDVPTTSLIKIILPQRQNRVNLDWPVQQFDVKNAFLHGDLSEEIYIDLPPGCSGPKQLNQKVYKLKKSLYGLKQSPRAWFGKFTKTMVSRSKGGIFLSQGKYALDLLHETGMTACQPIDTLIEERLKFCITSDQVPVDKGRYQSLIGRLMYLSHTRPDLAYALSVVSQFIHNPGEQHMKAVMRILRYLKTNPGKGILFFKNEDYSNIKVYTDANWAGSVSDRRSTSGYFTFVGGNLVTWRSKKQHVVARSSAEAEYRGMTLGVCEGLWISFILNDLGYPSQQPIQLYCDNKAARDIAHNPVQHDRTKHVEVDRFFIKEKLDEKIFELPKIRSEDQLPDILTKAISSRAFTKFLDKLGMQDIYVEN